MIICSTKNHEDWQTNEMSGNALSIKGSLKFLSNFKHERGSALYKYNNNILLHLKPNESAYEKILSFSWKKLLS